MSMKSQENNMRRLAILLKQNLSYIGGERECGPNGAKKAFPNRGKVFLRALAKEMVSLGTLTKIGEIVDIVDRNLESNLDYGEMIWFGERALGLKEGSIRFHNLPGDYTGTMWSPTYQNYQSYVFVNSSALRDLINQYMNPYLEDITPDMQHVVQDTTVNNLPVESDTTAQTGQAAGDTAQGQTTD